MGHPSGMVGVLINRGNLDIETLATRRTACEDEGSDQGAALKAEEHPRLPGTQQKPGERPGTAARSQHSEGPNPAEILTLDF